jgi:adenylate kinase family enzyme
MKRVVILGRGGAGKSTLAAELSKIAQLPLIELDKHFWSSDLKPMPPNEWIVVQNRLAQPTQWIMDGDLGKYDVLRARLAYADTILILDFSLARCAFRAIKRSRERLDFWLWLLSWRRKSKPQILEDIRCRNRSQEQRTALVLTGPLPSCSRLDIAVWL